MIKNIGIRETAAAIGTGYEAVRSWVNDDLTPSKTSARKLLAYLQENRTAKEYEEIKASMLSEMVGL